MTIPAKRIANVIPGVLAAGGSSLVLNGLFLTQNVLVPQGKVLSFPSQKAVSSFFGPAAAETAAALIYFAGYDNSTAKPSAMLFSRYNAANNSAWLQSGSLAGMTLAQLQALSGVLTITIDGTTETSSAINLAGAVSFTAAAALIQAGFSGTIPVVTWNAVLSAFIFTSPTTGASSSMTFASGTLAAGLKLDLADGATISAGAVADTPATAMANVIAASQNWESLVTLWEPVLADKEGFAAWFNTQNDEFVYLAWDSDVQACIQGATEPFGVVAKAAAYNGVACIGGDPAAVPAGSTLAALVLDVAIFVAGAIASINFQQTNGRVALAFLAQAGLLPTCADDTTAENLIANGYSFYGSYASRNNGWTFFYNGNMPGAFSWIDTFVDDAWMQDQFQVALMDLATSAGSIPYNAGGYGQIRSALAVPIAAAVNFGAIRAGVSLTAAQLSEVNTAAGLDVSVPLQNQGWYLQIKDPGASARAARTSPIINFWYTDGSSVQQFSMSATDIQ